MSPDPIFAGLPADLMDEPFTDDDLAAYHDPLDVPLDTFVDVERVERWQIEDDDDAEWAMRKHAAAAAQLATITAQAKAYKQQIDEWVDRVTRAPKRDAGFFEGHLIRYQQARLDADPKAGRLVIPSGEVRSTDNTGHANVKIDAPRVFAAWARENLPGPVLAAVLPAVDPKVLPSKLDADLVRPVKVGDEWVVMHVSGEQVPGCHAEPGGLSIKVVPS